MLWINWDTDGMSLDMRSKSAKTTCPVGARNFFFYSFDRPCYYDYFKKKDQTGSIILHRLSPLAFATEARYKAGSSTHC